MQKHAHKHRQRRSEEEARIKESIKQNCVTATSNIYIYINSFGYLIVLLFIGIENDCVVHLNMINEMCAIERRAMRYWAVCEQEYKRANFSIWHFFTLHARIWRQCSAGRWTTMLMTIARDLQPLSAVLSKLLVCVCAVCVICVTKIHLDWQINLSAKQTSNKSSDWFDWSVMNFILIFFCSIDRFLFVFSLCARCAEFLPSVFEKKVLVN